MFMVVLIVMGQLNACTKRLESADKMFNIIVISRFYLSQ